MSSARERRCDRENKAELERQRVEYQRKQYASYLAGINHYTTEEFNPRYILSSHVIDLIFTLSMVIESGMWWLNLKC